MWQKSCDILVVGAGPKGLAVQLELRSLGLSALLVEKHSAGHSWRRAFMNPRTPLTPSVPHEVTNHVGYRFVDFWRSQAHYELTDHKMSRGFHTAEHLRHYLCWLARRVGHVEFSWNLVELRWGGTDFQATFANGHSLRARQVVLATGLIGVGGQEFLYDPTGLLRRSPLVQHHPGTINTIGQMLQFVSDSRRVAIIGGGAASSSAVFQLERHTRVPAVLVISDHPLPKESSVCDGDLECGHIQSSIRRAFLRLIWNNSRFQVLDSTRLVGAELVGPSALNLTLQRAQYRWNEQVARLVLATGYRYNYRRISFLGTLPLSLLTSSTILRYPALDSSYRAVATDGRSLPLYFMGEAAAAKNVRERWLPSTSTAARAIAKAICR